MRIDIITVLPNLFDGPLNQSIMQRAQDSGVVEINIHNLRDYSTDKQKSVDDYQYGGGAGMVLMIEPISNAIEALKKKLGIDLGSGYQTDPKTMAFVESYWNKYPEVMRHSWKTFKKVARQTLGKY